VLFNFYLKRNYLFILLATIWCACLSLKADMHFVESIWRKHDPIELSFDEVIPDDWKIASVTPIYKKGWNMDPENYRPGMELRINRP